MCSNPATKKNNFAIFEKIWIYTYMHIILYYPSKRTEKVVIICV